MLRKLVLALSATAALGIANGCGSDKALAPVTEQRYSALDILQAQGSVRIGIDTVATLSRTVLLAADVSESAVIGPDGGTIEIEESGGRIIFPRGALTTRMRITMTAKAGWNVAYEFAPHGITFAVPVIVEQSLGNLIGPAKYRRFRPGTIQTTSTRSSLARGSR